METLKEFKNILLGQDIKVYTDHKNLTYKTHNSARVMGWRLTIEDFGPKLIYIPGNKNIVAKAISCLPLNEATNDNPNDGYYCADLLALSKDNFPLHAHPLNYKTIMQHQQEDNNLLAAAQRNKSYVFKGFTAAGQVCKLIWCIGKIVVPKTLQIHVVQWYHVQLFHPGKTRTEQTIRQHFTLSGLSKTVIIVCALCPMCQITKTKTVKYGKLPAKKQRLPPGILYVLTS